MVMFCFTALLNYVETTWLASTLWSPSTISSTNSKSEPTTTLRVGTGASTVSPRALCALNILWYRSARPRPVLHDGGPAVPRGADRGTAAPPAVGRQSVSTNKHTLRRCQPAPDGAVVAVRRRPAGCRRRGSCGLAAARRRMNDFSRRKRLNALNDCTAE